MSAEGVRAPAGSRYADQRPYVVVADLTDLRGPTGGEVRIDRRLNWSGKAVYDLDNPRRLASMYETVLREASTDDQLKTWLDADILARLWSELVVPPQVRKLWEGRFPQLLAYRRTAA